MAIKHTFSLSARRRAARNHTRRVQHVCPRRCQTRETSVRVDPLVGYAALLISLQAGHARRAEARAHEDKVDDRTAHECSFSLGDSDTRRLPEPRAVSGSEQRCIPDAVGRPRKNRTVLLGRVWRCWLSRLSALPAALRSWRPAAGSLHQPLPCDCGCRPPLSTPDRGDSPLIFRPVAGWIAAVFRGQALISRRSRSYSLFAGLTYPYD